jgi:hypothetical protein
MKTSFQEDIDINSEPAAAKKESLEVLHNQMEQGKFSLVSIVANQVTSNETVDSHSSETPIISRGKGHRAQDKGTPRKTGFTLLEVSLMTVA